jgi:hypothetical protein
LKRCSFCRIAFAGFDSPQMTLEVFRIVRIHIETDC